MEIHLDKRAIRQLRLAVQEAIDEDDTESLREDIIEVFTEEQIEEIERHLHNGDFFEFVTDVVDEWTGDDVDELVDLLETQLSEAGVDLKYGFKDQEEDDDDDADVEDEPDESDAEEDPDTDPADDEEDDLVD